MNLLLRLYEPTSGQVGSQFCLLLLSFERVSERNSNGIEKSLYLKNGSAFQPNYFWYDYYIPMINSDAKN